MLFFVPKGRNEGTTANQKETGNQEVRCSAHEFEKVAMRVSVQTIAVNALLTAFKLFAGIVADSGAMISDAVHSASDVLSTIIVMIGVKLSGRESDREHPYGHERMECVAAMILAMILLVTGLGIAYAAVKSLFQGDFGELSVPGMLALLAAVISIVTKEAMFWYTKINADRIHSGALMADAWHHRSDALSSVGALIGIGFARLGFPVMDAVASLVICLFIVKAAYDIFQDSVDKMVDKACDEEYENRLRAHIGSQPGVLGIDLLLTRVFGNRIYVELEIKADGTQTLCEAHKIAEDVHDSIEKNFPGVKHIMVHVNPGNEKEELIS